MTNSLEVWLLIAILLTHLLGDFLFQTDWMAINKYKRVGVLAIHVTVYSACFLWLGPLYALANGCAHFFVDMVTSHFTHKFHVEQKRHMFFVVIGIDQTIHFACLFASVQWLAWWV